MKIKKDSKYCRFGGDIPLYYTLFTPESSEVKATLLIIHGMQEHSGRYEEIAWYFAENGYVVLTYDHPGHGRSVKQEEDLGFFQKQKPGERLIKDADKMADILKENYPNLPYFVLGHSMGSFVTRKLLKKRGNDFSGAVIVGTGGRLPGIDLLKAYFAWENCLRPRKRGRFNTLFAKVNNRPFRNEVGENHINWLSLNAQNRKAFEEDPLCGIPFTHNGFYGLFSVYQQATKRNWWKGIPKTLPFLFVSGEADSIGNFGKGVKQSAMDLREHGFKEVKVMMYPRMRHEILKEEIKGKVFKDLAGWMEGELSRL